MSRILLNLFFVFVLAGLTACSSHPSPAGKPLPALTFDHLKAIPIQVANLKTENEQTIGFESFVISPKEMMDNYLHSRFVPQGASGTLKATIEGATVQHSYEKSSSSVGKFLDFWVFRR